MFRIFFSSHGERAFGVLPFEIQQAIVDQLSHLASDPLWYRRVKKLRGSDDRYRLRMGRWRILFILKKKEELEVIDIFLKKGASDYRRRR